MPATNMAEYMANRRKARRQKLLDMSGNCCVKCFSSENLEFNHKDRLDCKFRLNGYALDTAWDSILEEWKKCELLCKSCHIKYTAEQYKNKEIPIWNTNHAPHEHGSPRTYTELKCRCALCREAKRLYRLKSIVYSEIIAAV